MIRTSFLQLRYGSGAVIEPFLTRLFGERSPKAVYWVSPWITHLDFATGSTIRLLRRLRMNHVRLVVITRRPEPGTPHDTFVRDAMELPTASIYYMPVLHAKFYIAVTSERRYALLGSANMYEWSSRSFELGVVIESRGDGELLVDTLEQLAIDLRVTQLTTTAPRR